MSIYELAASRWFAYQEAEKDKAEERRERLKRGLHLLEDLLNSFDKDEQQFATQDAWEFLQAAEKELIK